MQSICVCQHWASLTALSGADKDLFFYTSCFVAGYVAIIVIAMRTSNVEMSSSTFGILAREAVDTDWQHEPRALQRLLKQTNASAKYSAIVVVVFVVFYTAILMGEDHYECQAWSINIVSMEHQHYGC